MLCVMWVTFALAQQQDIRRGGGGGQPASGNLTNWSNITTNEVVFTNQFRVYTNSLLTYFQFGSGNLTNFAGVTTNEVVFTNTFRLFTNYVNTNYTVTGVAAGTNGIVATTNAGVVTISNTKKFINYSFTQDTNSASTTSQIPTDDTIPQSGEGAQFGTYSYTAAASGNVVLVKITFYSSTSASTACSSALFLDSETDARAATIMSGNGIITPQTLIYKYTATDTSSHTWAMRFGPSSAATAYINRTSGGTLFSTRDVVTIEFWEFLP